MIEQTEEMNALLDAYENLLTDKQKEIMSLYFKEDFSLSEISETLHISRAAVSDHVKRSEKILLDYEKKLHLVKNYETRRQIYDKIKTVGSDNVLSWIKELKRIE